MPILANCSMPKRCLMTALAKVTVGTTGTFDVVTVGESPYTPTESVEALRDFSGPRLTVQLGASLPNDPRLAQLLAGGGRKAGRVCSSWFGPLATELATSTAYRSTPTLGRTAALSTSGGAQ